MFYSLLKNFLWYKRLGWFFRLNSQHKVSDHFSQFRFPITGVKKWCHVGEIRYSQDFLCPYTRAHDPFSVMYPCSFRLDWLLCSLWWFIIFLTFFPPTVLRRNINMSFHGFFFFLFRYSMKIMHFGLSRKRIFFLKWKKKFDPFKNLI